MSSAQPPKAKPSRTSTGLETIEVIKAVRPAAWLWSPIVGSQTRKLVRRMREKQVPEHACQTVEREAVEVLAQCVPPAAEAGSRVGLVVGFIQSGKTLSFTAVTALARDNGYPLVVVIAGTSNNLLGQTTRRLESDLGSSSRRRAFQVYSSHKNRRSEDDVNSIRGVLADWKDPAVPEEERRTVVLTVMKERTHLDWLAAVLNDLDLVGVPALVIDDEADQASLNVKVRRGEESSTYLKIRAIRDLLPSHTLLQYTATPQAILLISILDLLSPDFAALLTPGQDYTGGTTFFGESGLRKLIVSIPLSEVPSPSAPPRREPPPSLLSALRLFVVGVASGLLSQDEDAPRNRSMIVHPAVSTETHSQHARWVRAIIRNWVQILAADGDPDREDLVSEMRAAYDDLAKTAISTPPFSSIVERLPQALRQIQVREQNSSKGPPPQLPYGRDYAWIIVGAKLIDRGYTVEGLTVTYMPRPLGVGNADTIQQRARWFGYKAGYLGYCRVFLTDPTIQAYESYVEHEASVRRRLREHIDSGRPVQELRRVFRLDRTLRPTRTNVISVDYARYGFKGGWFWPRSAHLIASAVEANRSTVAGFWSGLPHRDWRPEAKHARANPSYHHLVSDGIPLHTLRDQLLAEIRLASVSNELIWEGLIDVLRGACDDDPSERARVLLMRPEAEARRGTSQDGSVIKRLFQGANPVYPIERRGTVYPGDSELHAQDRVTVQVHRVDVYQGSARDSGSKLLERDVPFIAVWLPERLRRVLVIQDQ